MGWLARGAHTSRTARIVTATVLSAGLAASLTSSPAAATAAHDPLAGFKANALSWLSRWRGWSMGTVPCGSARCTTVIGTVDAGTAWSVVGRVPAPIATPGRRGVTEVRFATPRVGWAYGPDLFRTTDGGHNWLAEPVPGGSGLVVALATDDQATYAVVSPCPHLPYCHRPFALWRTKTQATSWARVPLNLPSGYAADLAIFGSTVYVVEPEHDLTGGADVFLASLDGGRHFSTRPVPCDRQPAVALIQVVATSAHQVDLLCDGNPGFSKALKFVYQSTDTGRTDAYLGLMGLYGIQAELAVSPSGDVAVSSQSDGSFMYINDHAGRRWTMVLGFGDGGVGWNDIQYVSQSTAWVVYGPADFTNVGILAVTHDAGRTWTPITL